jgi:hypothetical protein
MTFRYSPEDVASFAWTGSGYLRWHRVVRDGRWWWELGGDWGQGIVKGLVLRGDERALSFDVDLTNPEAGGVSCAWVTDVLMRRLGPDGLGFEHETELAFGLDRTRVSLSGRAVVGGTATATLAQGEATAQPRTLSLQLSAGRAELLLGGVSKLVAEIGSLRPGLLMMGAGAHGALASKARWTDLAVDRG